MVFGSSTADEKTIADTIGVPPFFVKDYLVAARKYSYPEVENALLLLHAYNLKSVGIGSSGTPDGSLLKEMLVKMMA